MREQAVLTNASLKKYQKKFFLDDWQQGFAETHRKTLSALYHRVSLLMQGLVIFNDSLDMEPCLVPYSLSRYAWHTSPNSDDEWVYMLNRHRFILDLAMMSAISKESTALLYRKKWWYLIHEFIQSSCSEEAAHQLAWRPIDVGLRLFHWVISLTYLPEGAGLSEMEQRCLAKAIQHHIAVIEERYVAKYDLSNWGILAVSGVLATSLLLPHLVSEQTTQWAWQRLHQQLTLQIGSDGVHWEQTPLYHHQVLAIIAELWKICRYNHITPPCDVANWLHQMVSAAYYYTDNRDVLIALHDSDSVDMKLVYDRYRLLGLLVDGHIPESAARLWVGSCCFDKPCVPLMTPYFGGGHSGFYAFKTAEEHLTLFNGLHGSSHGHAAQGHLMVSAKQHPWIIGTGRYQYTESETRVALKSEAAHNALHVVHHPATRIVGSWTYERLATPLYHHQKTQDGAWIVQMGWTARDGANIPYIIQRTLCYLIDPKVLLLFDQFDGASERCLSLDFNLASQVTVRNTADVRTVSLYQGAEEIGLWVSDGKLCCVSALHAPQYNVLAPHRRISVALEAQDGQVVCCSAISLNMDWKATAAPVRQNQQASLCDLVHGVLLTHANTGKQHAVYYAAGDIVHGDKLLWTQQQQPFYGKLNWFDSTGQRHWLL